MHPLCYILQFVTYWLYNWWFVSLNLLHLFHHSSHLLPSGNHWFALVSVNLSLFCYIYSNEWPAQGYSSLICLPNFCLLLLSLILDWMLFIFLSSKAYGLWRLFKKIFFLSGIILILESLLIFAYHVYHISHAP